MKIATRLYDSRQLSENKQDVRDWKDAASQVMALKAQWLDDGMNPDDFVARE